MYLCEAFQMAGLQNEVVCLCLSESYVKWREENMTRWRRRKTRRMIFSLSMRMDVSWSILEESLIRIIRWKHLLMRSFAWIRSMKQWQR